MSRQVRSSSGFTLVEVMVATALVGIILWGVLTTNFQLVRSGVRITQYSEMEAQVRRGLETFGHDVKNAKDITWNGSADITLTVPTSAGTTTQATYAWNSATESFFVVPGADSRLTTGRIYLVSGLPALTGGTPSLAFSRFDRDGNPATTDLSTKRIEVSMTVKRKTSDATATQNSVSASFTMRNKAVE
jgi:prepilin-type N-terminal cleavage/methylation domain-containing protein